MKIGIIGAGRIGSTLAGHFAEAGHDVAISNSREPQSLEDTVATVNGRIAATKVTAMRPSDAAAFGEVVVLAVPFGQHTALPIGDVSGKTLVDATNYSAERDGHMSELDDGVVTSSELVQEHFPTAHVVKAFNTMRWDHLRDYGLEGSTQYRYGIPVAGDDDDAKYVVLNLINDIGFDPVDAGDLADGRLFEPRTEVYAADLRADRLEESVGVYSSAGRDDHQSRP